MKKLLAFFLVVLMIVSSIPFSIPVFAEDETEEEIIPVYTIEDLYAINNNMSGHYVLMNDIDMTEATAEGGDWDYMGNGWNPIGSGGNYGRKYFTGTFDGNGYEIIGMRINIPSDNWPVNAGDTYIGLFAANNGTIKNLGISGGEISITRYSYYVYNVGCVAGYNLGIIENCYNTAFVTVEVDSLRSAFVGGIVGDSIAGATITACSNTGNIVSKNIGTSSSSDKRAYSGGICGYCRNITISKCFNIGDIFSIVSNGYSYSGGIAGSAVGDAQIFDSYNIGIIESTSYSGGICGYYDGTTSSSRITNCYSIGYTTSDGYRRGIGYSGGGSITTSYYLTGTGDYTTDAISRTEAQMKLATCYTGFDFENTWFIDNSLEYKYPQLISNPQNTAKEVTDISVNISPEKTSYLEGEAFDENSFEIIAVYADGTTETITDYTISGFTGEVGENTITVTYKDKTATFTVKVHSTEEILAVAPSCTSTGLTKGVKCSNCGEILIAQEVVDANGHTVIVDKAVAPTCSTTGLTEGSHCDVCGEVLVAQDFLKEIGHTIIIDKAVAPTCTTTGLTEGTHCDVCGDVLIAQEVVDANGHTIVVDNAVAPTCTTTGLTEGSRCDVCGDVLVAQTVIKANGHTEITISGKPATCTEKGLTYGVKCDECNEVLVAQQTIKESGHIYGNDDVCDNCGNDRVSNCTHLCHKSGFMGFIWKIIRIFMKLFKITPVCSCGAAHY